MKKEFKKLNYPLPLIALLLIFQAFQSKGQQVNNWYVQDNYVPTNRIVFEVTNPLSIERKDEPVVIKREVLPYQNIPVRWISVVDPNLPGNKAPSEEELKELGGYVIGKEINGHQLEAQVDDIDHDGVWDEIFFLTDLGPGETRKFYIYFDDHERGMYPFEVDAVIGDYGRSKVPLFESEVMGWKLWYPSGLDLHGKRNPMLVAHWELSKNRSGYFMPDSMGTDIMTVAKTFGAGGTAVFEDTSDFENPSRSYFSPYKNKGPFKDTRYSFDLIYNGPLRSMVKMTTKNWNSGRGFYELEEYYTVVARKSWCDVKVSFNKFLPPGKDVMFGCGIRKIMEEYKHVHKPGIVISMGKNIPARIPDEDIGTPVLNVDWQGIAVSVKNKYNPAYHAIKNFGGNHLFSMPVTKDLSFEYKVFGAWSFGTVNNNEKAFVNYVEEETLKSNNPPVIKTGKYQRKGR